MSVEQVARDFVTAAMVGGDIGKLKAQLTADAMASGGMLPQPMPAIEAFKSSADLKAAFPDLKFEIQQVKVNGNQAAVQVHMSGTNTGQLNLGLPGMPAIPASGKKVSVKDAMVVTVQGDKVSHVTIDSPADGGLPAMLAQLGVKMPGM
jgi:predicted ester cyclase